MIKKIETYNRLKSYMEEKTISHVACMIHDLSISLDGAIYEAKKGMKKHGKCIWFEQPDLHLSSSGLYLSSWHAACGHEVNFWDRRDWKCPACGDEILKFDYEG